MSALALTGQQSRDLSNNNSHNQGRVSRTVRGQSFHAIHGLPLDYLISVNSQNQQPVNQIAQAMMNANHYNQSKFCVVSMNR